GDVSECSDFWHSIFSRRDVHGFDAILRTDLPYGDDTGIYGVSRFAARTRGMCRLPHRPRSWVVCSLETLRRAPCVRGDVPYLLAPDSGAGEVFAPGARDV